MESETNLEIGKPYRVKMMVAMTDGSAVPQVVVAYYRGMKEYRELGVTSATFSRRSGNTLNCWLTSLEGIIWAKPVRMNYETDRWVNI